MCSSMAALFKASSSMHEAGLQTYLWISCRAVIQVQLSFLYLHMPPICFRMLLALYNTTVRQTSSP